MKNKLLLLLLVFPFILGSCSDNDDPIFEDDFSVSVNINDLGYLKIRDFEVVQAPNSFIASLSASGTITPAHAGETRAILKTKGGEVNTYTITVTSKKGLFPDLKRIEGMTPAQVKDLYGTPNKAAEDGSVFYYYNIKPTQEIRIGFSKNNAKVLVAAVKLPANYTARLIEQLGDNYERYIQPEREGGEGYFYLNAYDLRKSTIKVLLDAGEDYIVAIYSFSK